MEVNVKEQTKKLEAEIDNLATQIQQKDAQINELAKAKSDLLKALLKKQGALGLIQELNADKPKK